MQPTYLRNAHPSQQMDRRNIKLNIITKGLRDPQSHYQLSPKQQPDDVLHIEDYFAESDNRFIDQVFVPYLKELYKDLLIRCNQVENVDKVTFIEYTKLPGIINDRFHNMFSALNKLNQN